MPLVFPAIRLLCRLIFQTDFSADHYNLPVSFPVYPPPVPVDFPN
jgi:hypothetical protein